MTPLRAMAVLASLLTGCATTSGRDWLSSPLEERAVPSAAEVVGAEGPVAGRPRLNHTVTLGESYASGTPRASATVAGGSGVQVNVQTQVPVVVNNYGGGYGYGYGAGFSSSAPVRASRSSVPTSQQVGADFPPVPDYGPPAMR